jgi:hypothetical protein
LAKIASRVAALAAEYASSVRAPAPISKRQVRPPELAPLFDQRHVERAQGGAAAEREAAQDTGLAQILVTQRHQPRAQLLARRPDGGRRAHHQVDDRLSGQSGDRRGADVLELQRGGGQTQAQAVALAAVGAGQAGVEVGDLNGLVQVHGGA